jgi:hypothetical protein
MDVENDVSKENKLLKKLIGIFGIIVSLAFFSYFIIINFFIKYDVETKGNVVDQRLMSELGAAYKYEFYVNGIQYTGIETYDCSMEYSDSLICKIKYSKLFPSFSKAYYNRKLSGCNQLGR